MSRKAFMVLTFLTLQICVIAVFPLHGKVCGSPIITGPLTEGDFTVAGVSLFQPIDKALKVLGKPCRTKTGGKNDTIDMYREYVRLTIGTFTPYDKTIVGYIEIKSKDIKTARGVALVIASSS